MNILILTPDAVGSTLLQQLLTIYCQFHKFDKPVINIHELSNGLLKFWSDDFNRELITKNDAWGKYQTLPEIVDTLKSTDHYKIARLARYHINRRKDSLSDQIPFYSFLDDNFYVIACRRRNLFEHAISLALTRITKKLNVFTAYEKIDLFTDMYRDPIELQPEVVIQILEEYKEYLTWSNKYFNIGSYFHYDDHVINMEKFILGLPMFSGQPKIGWEKSYGMSFDDWNRCHYYGSNIGALITNSESRKLLPPPDNLKEGTERFPIKNYLPLEQQIFIEQNGEKYNQIANDINKMRELGILVTSIPIKKQTFLEKSKIIKNFGYLMVHYNLWAKQNSDIASPLKTSVMNEQLEREREFWNPPLLTNEVRKQIT